MVTKNEALHLIKYFVAMAKTQFNGIVKIIRSDNALELGLSNEALDFFAANGIVHQTSCVQTPQQNEVVERKHKHLLEVSRSLLFQSHLPLKFWGDCLLTATYLINRMPSAILGHKSPCEMLFRKPPQLDHIRVFGCLCFMTTTKQGRDKLQDRALPCVFMGYPHGKKGYKVMTLYDRRLYISRDVVFYELVFPFANPTPFKSPLSPDPTGFLDFSDSPIYPCHDNGTTSLVSPVENSSPSNSDMP